MPRGAWRLASLPARRRRRLEGSPRPVPRTPRTARPDRRAAPGLCALPRHQVGHWEGRDPRAGPAPSGQASGRPWGSASGGAGGTRRPGSPCGSLTGERSWDLKRAARKPRRPNGQSAVSPGASRAGAPRPGLPPPGAPCRGPTLRWKRGSGSRVAERRAMVKATPRSGVCRDACVNKPVRSQPCDSATRAVAYRT